MKAMENGMRREPGREDGENVKRPKPLTRWQCCILILLALGFVLVVRTLAIEGVAFCSRQGDGSSAQVVGLSPEGTLHIAGAIDATLSRLVHEAVSTATVPIKRVWLNSVGGVAVEANKIGGEIQALAGDPVIEVPDRGTCQSACITLLAVAPARLDIKPTATLMFHAGAMRIGLARCGVCGWLNTVTVAVSSATQNTDQARQLLPAARALSDRLPALFDLCNVHPLDSQIGLSLYGREFNGLKNGTIKPASLAEWCPSS